MTEHGGMVAETLQARVLARGSDWWVSEFVCSAGPQHRPFEERHEAASISAVVAGAFSYRTDAGQALLHPGSLLLGNHGAAYECGHDHTEGDRCIAVQLAPDYFEEIAAAATGSARFRFPAAMLPAGSALLPQVAALEAAAGAGETLPVAETVVRLATSLLRHIAGTPPARLTPSAQDERRIARVLRLLEARSGESLDLDLLAATAAMSKFHFLRTFRRTVGQTPYQYLIGLRLRRAAGRLLTTREPVSSIAIDAGFGDLSTFNRRFRDTFGLAPLAYRRSGTAF